MVNSHKSFRIAISQARIGSRIVLATATAAIARDSRYESSKIRPRRLARSPACPQNSARTMLKLLADENFDNTIVRGLFRRNLKLDFLRVQDVGLSGKDDPTVLEWAAQEGRILLTHDVATITRYAYDRVE